MHRGFQCEYGFHNAYALRFISIAPLGAPLAARLWVARARLNGTGSTSSKSQETSVARGSPWMCGRTDPPLVGLGILQRSGYPCWPGSFPSICRILRFPGTSAESINAIEPGRRMWARLLLQLVPCWDEK